MAQRLVLITLFLGLSGCAARTFDDPISVMLDRHEDLQWRLNAADKAKEQMPDSPQRIKALNKLAWSGAHPSRLRIYAIDELVARDEDQFVKDLNRRIVLMHNWDVFDHVAKLGIDRHWPNFSAMIVRHYALHAHGIADRQRRERKVLETLNRGKTPEQVVYEVFANFDAKVPSAQQVAAWNLIYRLYGREALVGALAKAPDNTALVIDLKASARDLKVLPVNREGVLWLSYLREPARRNYWQKATAIIAQLRPEQLNGFMLRHVSVVMNVDPAALNYSREQLLQRVKSNIKASKHHTTGPAFDGPMSDYPQHLYSVTSKLNWADLLTMDHLWQAVNKPNVRRALFAQAQADNADISTEYGGVLHHQGDKYLVTSYTPMIRQHDLKFIPPNKMIQAAYTGLAHYHFHAQNIRNSLYAGPGVGDTRTAKRLNFNFLVFTYINTNQLNVDYYQPDGSVVDLGTINR